jgi:hypothetical protein
MHLPFSPLIFTLIFTLVSAKIKAKIKAKTKGTDPRPPTADPRPLNSPFVLFVSFVVNSH